MKTINFKFGVETIGPTGNIYSFEKSIDARTKEQALKELKRLGYELKRSCLGELVYAKHV